ncbi:MAG: 30S ribosomal protein S3 [Candidatus Doudnabacteria bacterium]|nr:30S ribosomal protein S3 [Candidatus Doudnabacteria bacterium]
MGQKINPKVLRLGITDQWRSRWISRGNFAKVLKEDVLIREFIFRHHRKSGVDRVEIERFNDELLIIIKTTKPGVLIGRAGGGIEELKKKLKKELGLKGNPKINIEEVKHVNLSAQVWAESIADQIEKRVSHRKLMKQALDQITDAGAKGVKIKIKGRLGGSEIARDEWLYRGSLPLHTLRSDIDYGDATAYTTYGTIGVKVWINKGEKFQERAHDKEF